MSKRSRPQRRDRVISDYAPEKMPLASLDHRQITDVVKRAGEGLQPLEHLCPVDARITRIRSGILSANPGGRTRSG